MKIKHILFILGALACAAGGFLLAQRLGQSLFEKRTLEARQALDSRSAEVQAAAQAWADAVSLSEGQAVLQAFVAGVAPAVLGQRRETIELAGVSLLRVPGVAGIHVLGANGEVLYSSDAKLTTTGEAGYRGEWALQASALSQQPSTRPGVIDFALPIMNAGEKLAVVWLEYDRALVRDAARPGSLTGNSQAGSSGAGSSQVPVPKHDATGEPATPPAAIEPEAQP